MSDHADLEAEENLHGQIESLRAELRDADRTIGKLADECQDKDQRIAELEAKNQRFRDALEQIALRKNGFIIPPVSPDYSDATWKDAVDALRQHARDALDEAEAGQDE